MDTENTLVVDDLRSLRMWRRQLGETVSPRNLSTIRFQLYELSREQNRNISALANSLQSSCGCSSGGLFMSVAVVTMILLYFASGARFSDIGLMRVATFVGVTVFAALSGKLVGLLWARWRLLRLARRTHDAIIRSNQQTAAQS